MGKFKGKHMSSPISSGLYDIRFYIGGVLYNICLSASVSDRATEIKKKYFNFNNFKLSQFQL